jgi:Tfp pilus assembly protein PilE
MKKGIGFWIGAVVIIFIALFLFWYIHTQVHFVTKAERRAIVVTEVGKALERYYDENGRYPVVYTNDELARVLSTKKYFDTDVRLDIVRYVPINNGQTYELQ